MVKEHHFFLFRHCVRSTGDHVDLLNGTHGENPGHYFAASLPDWNVPENECTEGGMDLVEKTGAWLWKQFASGGKKVQLEILSDESQRDIDTAYRLVLGIEDAADEDEEAYQDDGDWSKTRHVSFSPWLFDKFGWGICPQEYSTEEMEAAVVQRFSSLDPPSPSASYMLARLEAILGEGEKPLSSIPVNLELSSDKRDFLGAPAFLEHMAHVFFYSRASGIDFGPKATTEDIYQLLEWEGYTRSVLDIQNPDYAYRGAIHSNAMINVLRDGYYQKQVQHEEEDSYDSRITIVAGHDTDLDGLATALGAHWDLGSPYISGQGNSSYVLTPPMSGLHVRRNVEDGHISLSYMYPVYSRTVDDSKAWHHNSSGILESVPLLFEEHEVSSSQDDTATYMEYPDALDQLERHIKENLKAYTGAEACYSSAETYRASLQPNHLSESSVEESMSPRTSAEIGLFVVVGVMGLIAVVASLWIIRRKRMKFSRQQITIEQPDEEVEVL